MSLRIHAVPAFRDNYFWLFHPSGGNGATIVDPGAAAPVEEALDKLDLELNAILITHHHPDHTGGIAELTAGRSLPVYGPDSPLIPEINHILQDGDRVVLAGQPFKVMAVPGHTLDHLAYLAEPADAAPVLFCGDTLFAGGCGRLFEGTAPQMLESLKKIAALDPATRIYCAHEYTRANLLFGRAVEPSNERIHRRLHNVDLLRADDKPTIPTVLKTELQTNPFLRCQETTVIDAARKHASHEPAGEAEVFAIIRRWKDNF